MKAKVLYSRSIQKRTLDFAGEIVVARVAYDARFEDVPSISERMRNDMLFTL